MAVRYCEKCNYINWIWDQCVHGFWRASFPEGEDKFAIHDVNVRIANLLRQPVRDTFLSMEKPEQERAKEIGGRIKGRRNELGLTQEVLAERAGASKSFVSELEGGHSVASGLVYLKIATALDVNVDWLLTGNLPPTEPQIDLFKRVPLVSEIADELGWSHRKAVDVAEALSRIVARRTRDGKRWVPSREQILAVADALGEDDK